MDFVLIFKFLITNLKRRKIDFALIGGFALQAAGITRTTRDIDLVILSKNADAVKKLMLKHGYELIHESEDVLNFVGKKLELGRVDFLIAHRKYAVAMLKRAEEKAVLGGKFRVKIAKIEDLIGLKLQASANVPKRLRSDTADIELLLRNNYVNLDMSLVKEYFMLFDREKELKEILKGITNVE